MFEVLHSVVTDVAAQSFSTFKHLITASGVGERKGKSKLSLKATQTQEAAVKAFQHLFSSHTECHDSE